MKYMWKENPYQLMTFSKKIQDGRQNVITYFSEFCLLCFFFLFATIQINNVSTKTVFSNELLLQIWAQLVECQTLDPRRV